MGYELVDWEMSPKGRYVRVFIDKPKGVSVDDCARVSRQLTRLFAVEHVDFDRLEVVAGAGPTAQEAGGFRPVHGRGGGIPPDESHRQRPAREGHPARPGERRGPCRDRAWLEDRSRYADIDRARLVPRIEWRKAT